MITINVAVAGGQPCIRDTKITVKQIGNLIKTGTSVEEILEAYPSLVKEDIPLVKKYMAGEQPVQEIPAHQFSVEDMRNAKNAPQELSFEEWLPLYLSGEPMPVKEMKSEIPITKKEDEQNLPIESKSKQSKTQKKSA